jgi:cytochrome-b5 reductase
MAAISGKKDGGKQGQVGGVLKELGYTEDQVSPSKLAVSMPPDNNVFVPVE